MENLKDQDCTGKERDQPNKTSSHGGPRVPCIGMVFDEWEGAMTCYRTYPRKRGFSIRKNHTRLSRKDKSLIGIEFSCYGEGFRRHRSYHKTHVPVCSESMIGGKAMMGVRSDLVHV
ncbi:hypothetical protein RHMOL_Rhmol01G0009000 [Rhododendron molle]|uniref:Uncharacterized protein n=1 Tax=Rhododendron molle TaxID=49168 RepID=A0ACC0PY61_RHOML|nr:hypothetical protein RHMOL_Rhmol01G0009000 [Rhododendron molle]